MIWKSENMFLFCSIKVVNYNKYLASIRQVLCVKPRSRSNKALLTSDLKGFLRFMS